MLALAQDIRIPARDLDVVRDQLTQAEVHLQPGDELALRFCLSLQLCDGVDRVAQSAFRSAGYKLPTRAFRRGRPAHSLIKVRETFGS